LDTFVGRMATFSADAELSSADADDLSQLGRLYDEHHTAVYAFARRFVGEEAAWDLVHDTFLTLPKVLPRWNGASAIRTFIIGIAVNHARHHVRSSARRRRALAEFAAEPERSSGSPEREAEQQRLSQLLLRALDGLSFEHRSVFVLCEVEERSSTEVAQILAIPEGTVRTRLFHARQKLRSALEKQGLR
jgi:RNA polymerase sigma-70 factor, ECF subfamily